MKKIILVSLTLLTFSLTGCIKETRIKLDSKIKAVSVSNVQLTNNQIVIKGNNLESIKLIKMNEGSQSDSLVIESQSNEQIIANTLSNVSWSAGKIFDLILSSAYADSTYKINFSLCDSTLSNGASFDCTLTPDDKDVLVYDQSTNKWLPSTLVLPWSHNSSGLGNTYVSSGNVGIGTSSPTALFDINGLKTGTGTLDAAAGATTVTGTGTAFLSEVAVGDLILFTGNGDEKIVTAIASDTSLTVHSGMLLTATASAFTIRKRVSINNGVLTLGTSSVTPLIAGSGVFAGAYPKVDINTGNNTWQTYSEVMVMRHSGTGATANTRQLGFLFKLSNESSSGESQKNGGIMLESTTSYANNPNLSLVTYGSKRLTIDYLGNVAIGTTPVTTSRFTVSTTATSGSIANFVSTGAGGAGCSITWNGTSCSSDERLKENITTLTSPLEDVLKLRSVNFNWKKDQNKENQIGYVAQEVEKVIPEVVRNDSNGFKQVNYGNIVSLATGAIQEFFQKWQDDSEKLHREIAALKEENELKKQEIELLKSRLDNLEKKSKN